MKKLSTLLLTLLLIMTLAVGCSGDTAPSEDVDQQGTENEESSVVAEVPAFTMEINGTEFTQDDAVDLEYVTKDVQKTTKDGTMKDHQYSGYQVDALLKAAGITDYSSVTVEAADGYAGEITAEQAQLDTTLFGLAKTDEELTTDEIPTLVVDGEGSNIWVKGIVKVTTK